MPNSAMRKSAGGVPRDPLTQWVATFGLFALILFAAIGLQPFQVSDNVAASAGGDSLRQVLFIGFFGTSIFAAIDRARLGIKLFLPREWGIILFFCLISSLWALDPSISIRRGILTTFVVMAIFAFVKTLTPPRAMMVIWYALVAILFINYISVALVPAAVHLAGDFTDESIIGAWRGAVRHKNVAGPLCVITCFYAIFIDRLPKWQKAGVIVMAIFFLVKSQSKTSMGIGCLSIAFAYSAIFMRRLPKLLVLVEVIMALLIVALIVWALTPMIGDALSDGSALTGRATIWPALLRFLDGHWMLGAGYGSFWVIGDKSPIYEFGAGWVTDLAQGHNGYLDLAIQLGVPLATIVVGLGLVWPLVRIFTSARMGKECSKIALATTFFVIGQNFTETTFMERDAPVFVMLLVALGLADRQYWEPNPRARIQSRRSDGWPFQATFYRPANTAVEGYSANSGTDKPESKPDVLPFDPPKQALEGESSLGIT